MISCACKYTDKHRWNPFLKDWIFLIAIGVLRSNLCNRGSEMDPNLGRKSDSRVGETASDVGCLYSTHQNWTLGQTDGWFCCKSQDEFQHSWPFNDLQAHEPRRVSPGPKLSRVIPNCPCLCSWGPIRLRPDATVSVSTWFGTYSTIISIQICVTATY